MSSAARQERLHELRLAGFGWVRQRIDWADIEPQHGVYDWYEVDAIIADIRASGLEPFVVLDGSPAWSRANFEQTEPSDSLGPPDDLADFEKFVRTFASRYADDVRFYQIWDEPNIAPHWGDRWINPVEYTQMLRLASTAILETDPDAVILMGALAPTVDRGHLAMDESHFLLRMYAAGAQPYFDAVAIQPYGFGYAADDTTQRRDVLNFHRSELVRRVMVSAGDARKPIVATRYGWNRQPTSPWRTVSPANQSLFTHRALDIGYRDWPWIAALGYATDQPYADTGDPMWGFSLDDELMDVFRLWAANQPARDSVEAVRPHREWRNWSILLALSILILWRIKAVVTHLPLDEYRMRYISLHPAVRVSIWAILLVVFAVSPPATAALCIVVAASLVFAQPIAGLWLAAAALPFYFLLKELDFGLYAWSVAPSTAIAFTMLPALIVNHRCSRRSLDRWDALAVGWAAVTAVSAFGVWHWPAFANGVVEFTIVPLILFWSIRTFTKSGRQRRSILYAMITGALLMAGFGLWNWLNGSGTKVDDIRRLTATFYSANHAALYLERAVFISIGLAVYNGTRCRRWLIALSLLLLVTLILTASRGALLLGLPTGAAVLALYAFLRGRERNGLTLGGKRPLLTTISIVAVSTIGIVILASLFGERLTNVDTMHRRLQLWSATIDLLRDYWLTGVGPHGFYWRFPAFIPVGSQLDPNLLHPHNVWLEYAATGGILASLWLLTTIALVGATLIRSYRTHSPAPAWPAIGIVAALAASFAHAQIDAFSALPDLAAWNWLAIGLLAAGVTRKPSSHSAYNDQ